MKRIAPIIIVIVLAVAAIIVFKTIASKKTDTPMLGSGIIEATEIRVSTKTPGRLAEMLVREGDVVERGQVIARLEHEDIDAEIARAEAAVETTGAMLRDIERGSRPELIEAARARVAEATSAREGAQRQLATARESYGKVTELRAQVDVARGKVDVTDARIAQATAQLDEARRGPTDGDIATLRAVVAQGDARVASARTAVENTEEIYAQQIALQTPVILASTEESVLRANIGLTEKELGRATTMSEADAGTVQALDQASTRHAATGAQLDGASRVVEDARTQVALTRAQAKQIRDSAQTALAEAVKARDSAQAKLNVLLAGTREERVRLAEAALEAARAEAAAAGDGLRNAEELHEDRLAARQGRDAAETALDSATARQRMARAELGLLLAGATEEAIDAARGRLAEAEAALGAAEVRRSYCEIEAPCAGTVTDVVTDLGETAATGTTVVVVSDLENMWLRAYVGFANLGQVTLGETFSIATEAVPERAFAGTVIRVSDEAEFTPKDVQTPDQRMTQVYWVKVGVGDGMGLLKPGMPADLLPAD